MPTSTNCAIEVVSSATKIAIRSLDCASSTIAPVAVSSSAKNSGRCSTRERPSEVAITTASETPISRKVKNSAKRSTTIAPESAGPSMPETACTIAQRPAASSTRIVSARTGARRGAIRSAVITTPAPSSSAKAGPM